MKIIKFINLTLLLLKIIDDFLITLNRYFSDYMSLSLTVLLLPLCSFSMLIFYPSIFPFILCSLGATAQVVWSVLTLLSAFLPATASLYPFNFIDEEPSQQVELFQSHVIKFSWVELRTGVVLFLGLNLGTHFRIKH